MDDLHLTAPRLTELAREPFPHGFMAFTTTKNRILNLHKMLPNLVATQKQDLADIFTEAVRCGALDTVVFMMAHGLCEEADMKVPGPAKTETQATPGVLVFLNQMFPKHQFHRYGDFPKWTFQAFGGKYPTLSDAMLARDPLAVIQSLVFEPHDDLLTHREVDAMQSIVVPDEERYFFNWLVWDWLPGAFKEQHAVRYDEEGNICG